MADLFEQKRRLRTIGLSARRDQADKTRTSRDATDRVMSMPQYDSAATVMWYVSVRDEVRTGPAIESALRSSRDGGKRVVVPFCVGQSLQCFDLRRIDDLATGRYGIAEPRSQYRDDASRWVDPREIDLIVVPGVAFDANGGRIGHGKGYYDRFLPLTRPETMLVGLAFDPQIVPAVPMQSHDRAMDAVVTPTRIFYRR